MSDETITMTAAADELHCSWCDRSATDAKKLIAGPCNLFICDECVDLCHGIMHYDPHEPPENRLFDLVRLTRTITRSHEVTFPRGAQGTIVDYSEDGSFKIRLRSGGGAITVAADVLEDITQAQWDAEDDNGMPVDMTE